MLTDVIPTEDDDYVRKKESVSFSLNDFNEHHSPTSFSSKQMHAQISTRGRGGRETRDALIPNWT